MPAMPLPHPTENCPLWLDNFCSSFKWFLCPSWKSVTILFSTTSGVNISKCGSILLLLLSHQVVSNFLWPYGLQHARLPCLSLSPGACLSSYPLNQWCCPTISSSVTSFSSCPQSFPASESFPMSRLFASGGQSSGKYSASESVLPMNIQDWFPLELIGLISLQSKGFLSVFSTPQFKSIHSLAFSFHYSPSLTSIHDYWKDRSFD